MKGWQIPWEQFIIFVMILVGMACRCCGGWSTFGIGWEPQLDDLDGGQWNSVNSLGNVWQKRDVPTEHTQNDPKFLQYSFC